MINQIFPTDRDTKSWIRVVYSYKGFSIRIFSRWIIFSFANARRRLLFFPPKYYVEENFILSGGIYYTFRTFPNPPPSAHNFFSPLTVNATGGGCKAGQMPPLRIFFEFLILKDAFLSRFSPFSFFPSFLFFSPRPQFSFFFPSSHYPSAPPTTIVFYKIYTPDSFYNFFFPFPHTFFFFFFFPLVAIVSINFVDFSSPVWFYWFLGSRSFVL